jgi:CO/xanthine dehydrogenase FAD-binding subunit
LRIFGGFMREAQQTVRQIFYPGTLQELFAVWDRFPGAALSAGASSLSFQREGGCAIPVPGELISLNGVEELRRFSRTERYLETGAMVRLDEIVNMGKLVPGVFISALSAIRSPQLRNIATIGGHLCCPVRRLDAVAPLIALDARYELRTASASRWITASRFSAAPGPLLLNKQELLTRVRIPLDPWDYSAYKKFTGAYTEDDASGSLVFLARYQKNILTDIRIVYAGKTVIRDRNSEAVLTGKQLPLTGRDLTHFMELWAACLSAIAPAALNDLTRAKMLNFIESRIRVLTD